MCSDVVEDLGPVLGRAGNQTKVCLGSKPVPPCTPPPAPILYLVAYRFRFVLF